MHWMSCLLVLTLLLELYDAVLRTDQAITLCLGFLYFKKKQKNKTTKKQQTTNKQKTNTRRRLHCTEKFNYTTQLYTLHPGRCLYSCCSLPYSGRTARLQRKGKATSFLTLECKIASELRELLASLDQPIPPALENTKQFGKRVVRTELGDRTID